MSDLHKAGFTHLKNYLEWQNNNFGGCCSAGGLEGILPSVNDLVGPASHGLTPTKTDLERFFLPLIVKYHFGYVLFGTKPLARGAIVSDELKLSPEEHVNRNSYEAFARHTRQFPAANFSFRLFEKSQGGAADFIVFEPNRIRGVVESASLEFRSAFGYRVDGEVICARLMQEKSLEAAMTDKDGEVRYDLLGLLYGFPKISVVAFDRLQHSGKTEDNINFYSAGDLSRGESKIMPVRFRASIDDPEAKKVMSKFRQEQERIDSIIQDSHWIDKVLAQL